MDDAFWVAAAMSDLAALADNALTFKGSVAYEQVLLDFDERVARIRVRIAVYEFPLMTCATSTPVA